MIKSVIKLMIVMWRVGIISRIKFRMFAVIKGLFTRKPLGHGTCESFRPSTTKNIVVTKTPLTTLSGE
jgi:hypothetical protein